jgi:hypothetical protein
MKAKKHFNITPITNSLCQPETYVDNELDNVFKLLSFKTLLKKAGFKKVKGDPISQVMFALIIWPLFDVKSIASFCGKTLSTFIQGGMNVLYDFQKREDLNWRKIRQSVAKKIYKLNGFSNEKIKAFVFDDSIRIRSGKKVEGTSSHFDHTSKKHVQGHQVLEMGFACPKGFMPLDSQIFIGSKNVIQRIMDWISVFSAVFKDYQVALNQTKNEMMRSMLKRAKRLGFIADYVIADSWFGTKGNILAVIKLNLIAIFRMKKSKLKYRLNEKLYTAKGLYIKCSHKMKGLQSQPWKIFKLTVEINLEENPAKKEQWRTVNLLFVKPKKSRDAKKEQWALFLCTDVSLAPEQILEVYALRWGIEVYFKEVKQNMGFLREQTGNYVCHYASIHLSALRYLFFFQVWMDNGSSIFSDGRKKVKDKLQMLSFASLLWGLFRTLIYGVVDEFQKIIDETVLCSLKDKIQDTVCSFLEKMLQLDSFSLESEEFAERAGLI